MIVCGKGGGVVELSKDEQTIRLIGSHSLLTEKKALKQNYCSSDEYWAQSHSACLYLISNSSNFGAISSVFIRWMAFHRTNLCFLYAKLIPFSLMLFQSKQKTKTYTFESACLSIQQLDWRRGRGAEARVRCIVRF